MPVAVALLLPPRPPPVDVPPGDPGSLEDAARALHAVAADAAAAGDQVARTAAGLVDGWTWCGPLSSRWLAGSSGVAAGCEMASVALLRAAEAVAGYARTLYGAQATARSAAGQAEDLLQARAVLASRWEAARAARGPLDTDLDHLAEEGAFRREAERIADEVRQVGARAAKAGRAADDAERTLTARLAEAAAAADALQPTAVAPGGHTGHSGLLGQLGGFVDGVRDGVVGPVTLAGGLIGLHGDAGENWGALADGLGAAVQHPADTAKAMVGWEDLASGEYGHWAGELIPGAAAALATGGGVAAVKGADTAAGLARTGEALGAARAALAARLALGDDAGFIDWAVLLHLRRLEGTDGRVYERLTDAERKQFEAGRDALRPDRDRATGRDLEFQKFVYPESERVVSTSPEIVVADGFNPDFGAMGDAKLRDSGRSWYVPSSMSPGIRKIATGELDKRLMKYKAALEDPANPARLLEIVTNDLEAAAHIEERMRVLKIPGYVLYRPWEGM